MDFQGFCTAACGLICTLLLAISSPAAAQANQKAEAAPKDPPLSITVDDSALTLMILRVPTVYVSGVIDHGSPERFEALMRAGKVPVGAIIYLNSPGGDLAAGLELGRLFRKGEMRIYIDKPLEVVQHEGKGTPQAICVSACAYAYFGGTYRMAPSGDHQFGIHQFYFGNTHMADVGSIQQASGTVVSYLQEMGIDPNVFLLASTADRSQVVWLTGPQMLQAGLANNGKDPLKATVKLAAGHPYLVLQQDTFEGIHKIGFECLGKQVMLTSFYMVGQQRAQEIVQRGIRSYFEVNERPVLIQEKDGVVASGQSVSSMRMVPLDFLRAMQSTESIGAWLDDMNGTHRYGFTIQLQPVWSDIQNYYRNCLEMPAPKG
jgi:hypothetical protein